MRSRFSNHKVVNKEQFFFKCSPKCTTEQSATFEMCNLNRRDLAESSGDPARIGFSVKAELSGRSYACGTEFLPPPPK